MFPSRTRSPFLSNGVENKWLCEVLAVPSAETIEAEIRAEGVGLARRTSEHEQSEVESLGSRASVAPAFPYVLQYLEDAGEATLHELSAAGDLITASAKLPANLTQDWSVSTEDGENYFLSSASMGMASWAAGLNWVSFFR